MHSHGRRHKHYKLEKKTNKGKTQANVYKKKQTQKHTKKKPNSQETKQMSDNQIY